MKKGILFILFAAIILTACSAGPTRHTPPQANPQEQPATASIPPAQVSASPQTEQLIGEAKAREIALQKAGISAEDAVFQKIELDRDNGILQYEVEFRRGQTEYNADIKADDGSILEWEMDIID